MLRSLSKTRTLTRSHGIGSFIYRLFSGKEPPELISSFKSNFANRRKSLDFSYETKMLRSVYPSLVEELLDEQLYYHKYLPEARQRYFDLINYVTNLDDEFLASAKLAVRAYTLLEKPSLLTEENLKKACILGWCFRMTEAAIIMYDDIVDNSQFRYNKPTWFKKVGLNAALLDGAVLETNTSYLLLNHFYSHPQFKNIFKELVRDYSATMLSQYFENQRYRLEEFEKYENLVKAYPVVVPPIVAAMYLANYDEGLINIAKELLKDIGIYIKAEDDFEGLYSEMGKDVTDAAEARQTWLAIQVAKRGTQKQKEVFEENYGKYDKKCLAEIYQIYEDLGMKKIYREFQENFYEDIYKKIQVLPKDLPAQLFLDILDFSTSGMFRS